MKDVKMNLTFDNVRFAELIDARYKEDSTKYPYCKDNKSFYTQFGCTRQTLHNWKTGVCAPSLNDFITLCNLLNCDPNYLLGKNDIVSEDLHAISKKLRLSEKSIQRIADDKFLAGLLNYYIEADSLEALINTIKDFSLTEFISKETLDTAFMKGFKDEVELIFAEFYINTSPLNRNEDTYLQFLKSKIPYASIMNTEEEPQKLEQYIKSCITEDTLIQVMGKLKDSKDQSDEKLYNIFMDDIVMRTYDIFFNKHIRDIRLSPITQTIGNLLLDFNYKSTLKK